MTHPFEGVDLGSFGVILADPPWHFATRSPKGWGKSPQHHYATMTLDGICALPVADLAAPDCALVLWATAPHLPQAFTVMAAWGFKFKTAGAWAKRTKTDASWQFGTGYILRSASEFFLVGTRGKPKVKSRSIRNLIVAPVGRHSEKPRAMHAMCEALWPDAKKAELFARMPARGWFCWGNELGAANEQAHEEAVQDRPRRPDHGAETAAV